MDLGHPDAQTKIALFVGAAKTVNAAILCAAEMRPHFTLAWSFVCGHYLRELAFATLLARVTRWSADPAIYAQGAALAAPLWTEWWRIRTPPAGGFDAHGAYAGLALGHALLARVRVAPLLSRDAGAPEPFAAALRRIERENGPMLHAQVRLLKEGVRPPAADQRERLFEAARSLVDESFSRFLQWLPSDVDQ